MCLEVVVLIWRILVNLSHMWWELVASTLVVTLVVLAIHVVFEVERRLVLREGVMGNR